MTGRDGAVTGTPPAQPDGAPSRSATVLAAAHATPGFLDQREGMALFAAAEVAAQRGLGPLVEIGAYLGRSTLYLAAGLIAALEHGAPPSILLSIDHHRGSEEMQAGWEHHDATLVDPATGRMDSLPRFRANLWRAGAEDIVAAVVGDSARVAAALSGPVGMVFIDGGHGANVAWADYRGWTPRLAPGGLLAIHDVFPDPADGGRPPYECYCAALDSGEFEELEDARTLSLRVLTRRRVPRAPQRASR